MGWWILAAAVLIAGGTVFQAARRARRDRKQIAQGFGAVPDNRRSLFHAASYWACYHEARRPAHAVDALTWANLDMDDVFLRVNACQSEAGDARLYQTLHLPLADGDARDERAQRLRFLAQHADVRMDVQFTLRQIGRDRNGTEKTLVFEADLLDERYKVVVYLLAALPFAVLPLFFVSTTAGLAGLVASLLLNFVSSYLFKSRNSSYQVVYPLAKMMRQGEKLAKQAAGYAPRIVSELRQCARGLHAIRLSLAVMSASDFFLVSSFPDTLGLFQLPMLSYYWALRAVKKSGGTIERLYDCVGDLDVDCCLLSYRASLEEFCVPVFTAEKELRMQNACHPLLAAPVGNNLATGQSILLTGSNASGKSTFIKTVAVNCVLAQCIRTCCAKSFAMAPGGVVTAIAVKDDIVEGDSYFVAEIKALKRMLAALDGTVFHYFFIDEILRGTNTVERIGASQALLRFLAAQNCLCFAATHDVELTALLEGQYRMHHFSETVEGESVTFSYHLHGGPAQTRNALKLLEVFGFPRQVSGAARTAVKQYETMQKWEAPSEQTM